MKKYIMNKYNMFEDDLVLFGGSDDKSRDILNIVFNSKTRPVWLKTTNDNRGVAAVNTAYAVTSSLNSNIFFDDLTSFFRESGEIFNGLFAFDPSKKIPVICKANLTKGLTVFATTCLKIIQANLKKQSPIYIKQAVETSKLLIKKMSPAIVAFFTLLLSGSMDETSVKTIIDKTVETKVSTIYDLFYAMERRSVAMTTNPFALRDYMTDCSSQLKVIIGNLTQEQQMELSSNLILTDDCPCKELTETQILDVKGTLNGIVIRYIDPSISSSTLIFYELLPMMLMLCLFNQNYQSYLINKN